MYAKWHRPLFVPQFQQLWPLGLPVSGPSELAILPVLNVFSMALSSSIRIQLPELELGTSHHPGPSRSGRGRGERTLGGVVPPLQSPLSGPILTPGPARQRGKKRYRSLAASSPSSAGGRGWLETCGRPGQAGDLAPLHEDISSLVQSGFRREARGSVGVGREELLGPPLAPLAFPVGLCSPLSTAKALLFSPPHSLVTRAFLTVKGAHLCPKWLVK